MSNKYFKWVFLYIILFIPIFIYTQKLDFQQNLKQVAPGEFDSTWWNRKPIRLIQTNFPAIYASMEVDDYVNTLLEANANAVLFNTGGIVANYDTKLKHQHKNPYMKNKDFVRLLLDKVHAEGIRYIARFDFSKVFPEIAEENPEWLYVGEDGGNQEFNGVISVCINGGYYQEYSFKILEEVIENYDIDGIFFNMMGYTRSTYAGDNQGICQCNNCQTRFKEYTNGLTLPKSTDTTNLSIYRKFQRETSFELYKKVTDFIKSKNNDLIIYNYNDVGTSWIASESGGNVLRFADKYVYNATNNVKRVLGSYKDHIPVNLVMGFQAIGFRNVMESPNLLRNWLLENLIHGAPLGFVVVGTLYHYEDRSFIPHVNEIYKFHKEHELIFQNITSSAQVGLVQNSHGNEVRGLINLLSEEHILYDIINPSRLSSHELPKRLNDYELLILNNIGEIDSDISNILDQYVSDGGKLLIMGNSGLTFDNVNYRLSLKSAGVDSVFGIFDRKEATYLKIFDNDLSLFQKDSLDDFSLMMMHSDFNLTKGIEDAQVSLRLLPTNMYGPAEVTWYDNSEITEYPGFIYNKFGLGEAGYLPWNLGQEYYLRGNYIQRKLFLGILNNVFEIKDILSTDAPSSVELSHMVNNSGNFEWIGLVNHSGFLGNSVRDFVPIGNINFKISTNKQPKSVNLVNQKISIPFEYQDGVCKFSIETLNEFEVVLLTY